MITTSINGSGKRARIETPSAGGYEFKISNPEIYSILNTLEKGGSRLNKYVEEFGISLRQILDVYDGNLDPSEAQGFKEKYGKLVDECVFLYKSEGKIRRIRLAEILEDLNNRTAFAKALRDFSDRVDKAIEDKRKMNLVFEEVDTVYNPSIPELALNNRKKIGQKKVKSRQSDDKKNTPVKEASEAPYPFSPEILDPFKPEDITTCSYDSFRVSLLLLPRHKFAECILYINRISEIKLSDEKGNFKRCMLKIINGSTHELWRNFLDEYLEVIFEKIPKGIGEENDSFEPKTKSTIVAAEDFSEDLLDVSSERKFLASLIYLDHKLGHKFFEYMSENVKYKAYEWIIKEGVTSIRTIKSKNRNGFKSSHNWLAFVTGSCPTVYKYFQHIGKYPEAKIELET